MGQGPLVSGNPGELIEKLVLEGGFRGHIFGRMVIPEHHVTMDDELVLVEDRFQSVDDPQLFLPGMLHLFDCDGIGFEEVGLNQFGEHAVPEVGLNDDMAHAFSFGELDDGLERRVAVAVPVGPQRGEIEKAVEHLDYDHRRLVSAPAGRVDSHDGPGVGNP